MILCKTERIDVYGAVKSTKSPQLEVSVPYSEIENVKFLMFPPSLEIKTKSGIFVYVDVEYKSNFKNNYFLDWKELLYIEEFKL